MIAEIIVAGFGVVGVLVTSIVIVDLLIKLIERDRR